MDVISKIKDHQKKVEKLLLFFAECLAAMARNHDASKLEKPEIDCFLEYTPKLATVQYGSDEYKKLLENMGPALHHHYANNPHHPECFQNGVLGMNLLSLLEMWVDWYVSSNGKIDYAKQQERFGYDGQIQQILENMYNNFLLDLFMELSEETDQEVRKIVFDRAVCRSGKKTDHDQQKTIKAEEYLMTMVHRGWG